MAPLPLNLANHRQMTKKHKTGQQVGTGCFWPINGDGDNIQPTS